eukprot:Clim_evm111s11 gene=Clim_evmTU111s11
MSGRGRGRGRGRGAVGAHLSVPEGVGRRDPLVKPPALYPKPTVARAEIHDQEKVNQYDRMRQYKDQLTELFCNADDDLEAAPKGTEDENKQEFQAPFLVVDEKLRKQGVPWELLDPEDNPRLPPTIQAALKDGVTLSGGTLAKRSVAAGQTGRRPSSKRSKLNTEKLQRLEEQEQRRKAAGGDNDLSNSQDGVDDLYGEESPDEEDLEDSTDYGMSYFDNGEGYGDDEDEGDAEASY